MLAKIQLSCPPSPGLVRPLYHMSHDGLIPPDGGQCRHGGRHSLHNQDLWGLSLEKRARASCHIFLSLRKRYHSPLPDNLGLKMLAKKGENMGLLVRPVPRFPEGFASTSFQFSPGMRQTWNLSKKIPRQWLPKTHISRYLLLRDMSA